VKEIQVPFRIRGAVEMLSEQNILAVVLLDDASGNGVSLVLVLSVSKPAEVIGVL
jgi:hypothetical protein